MLTILVKTYKLIRYQVGFFLCFSCLGQHCQHNHLKSVLVDSPFANFGNCEFEFNLSTFVENCLIVNLFISWIDSLLRIDSYIRIDSFRRAIFFIPYLHNNDMKYTNYRVILGSITFVWANGNKARREVNIGINSNLGIKSGKWINSLMRIAILHLSIHFCKWINSFVSVK